MAYDDHEGHFHEEDASKSMLPRLPGIQTAGSNNKDRQ